MINLNFSENQFLEIVKVLFTVAIFMALLIIFIFHHYRNKYLTLTKK